MGSKSKAAAGGALVLAIGIIGVFEGYRPAPYSDPIGIPTVCYGHTGKDVKLDGKARSPGECRELLNTDLQTAWDAEDRYIKVPLEPWTRAALASFIFNVGPEAFAHSTLLSMINSGRTTDACNELLKWVNGGGQPLQGLIRRREAERDLCLGLEWQG